MLTDSARHRIKGNLPQKRDIPDWWSEKLLALLQFIDFFTDKKTGRFAFTTASVETAKRRSLDENFWDEFITRINEENPGKFSKRFLSLSRVPLSWLKSNPHAVTKEMFDLMEGNPRMQWASKAFKTVQTQLGTEIVMRDQGENTDPNVSNPHREGEVASPQVKFEQAKLNMLTILLDLSKNLPADQLKKMVIKDRLAAFNQLLNTATKVMGAGSPRSVVFQSINVNKANREDLEKSFLSYAENQNE